MKWKREEEDEEEEENKANTNRTFKLISYI